MENHDRLSDGKKDREPQTTNQDVLEGEVIEGRTSIVLVDGRIVNASGHRDQLKRQYGLLSIAGLALTIDNAWVAFGGSLSVAILNGGPPGVLYEFITACVVYAFIGASIAELASAAPTSGGVYHWASVTAGRWGRSVGFFAGYLNFFGYLFDLASIVSIPANVVVEMYAVFHPDFTPQPWHVYVAFVILTWLCTAIVIFLNRLIPLLQRLGLFLITIGGLVTIIVVTAMPAKHASASFVFKDFNNLTGWSGGIAFLTGVLNGCFTIGTPDAVTHLAGVDLPKAIFAQIFLGFVTTFVYAIAILYSINDLDAVVSTDLSFPLAEVYRQATGNAGGTFGLLLILFLSIFICTISTILMLGRLLWTLARDGAVIFPGTLASVNEQLSCPIPATILCAILTTGLGAIQLGSKAAFTDLVGSFIILTTMSFLLTILPHMLTRRSTLKPGPFFMHGVLGYIVNGIACVLIVFFSVWFSWPYAYPVTVGLMNWNSVIFAGVLLITLACWFIRSPSYDGPRLAELHH